MAATAVSKTKPYWCAVVPLALISILSLLVISFQRVEGTEQWSLAESHVERTTNARIRVDFDTTVISPEAAECLEMVMSDISARVNQLFDINPEAIGRVTVRVVRGELFFEGNIGGSG
ncbi:MAG: hypothetical protein AB1700_17375, partial [Bacillota bacterium]